MTMILPPLFQRLLDEQVEFVIVGGLAAVALGVPYVTNDVDICYNPDPANITRLASALAPLHPRLRVEGLSDEEARLLPFQFDERTLRQSAILTLQTDTATLDLMSSVIGVGPYLQVRQAAIELEAFGFRLAVLDLPGLLVSKRAAGRTKDLLALPQIEGTLRLREQHPPKPTPPTEQ
ncbi:MAG: nucleotidyltransferase [Ktedonobacterales bacterium]